MGPSVQNLSQKCFIFLQKHILNLLSSWTLSIESKRNLSLFLVLRSECDFLPLLETCYNFGLEPVNEEIGYYSFKYRKLFTGKKRPVRLNTVKFCAFYWRIRWVTVWGTTLRNMMFSVFVEFSPCHQKFWISFRFILGIISIYLKMTSLRKCSPLYEYLE